MLKEKHDIAQFIYEELQLAPWYLTGEFIDVHKKSEGSGMMQLSGLGDPSGFGEGFSFLRKIDNKPAKASTATNSELNDHVKKITVRKAGMNINASFENDNAHIALLSDIYRERKTICVNSR